jgi:hypothetical protein
LCSSFVQIVGKSVIDVPIGERARNDGFGFHLDAPTFATLRTRSRNPSK